ncbi:hypothetical protein QRX50_36335 [Amycolatopsis carbonis]|uniref:Uncharacterized protein n=1 Tax=Amycolatopsis carbonis TaxID=715471 RepID=A0A9Y2IEF6_9PSEU|nr:hypothetical protein [Amycolatopsis sp. 2-15]WIX76858.1 hypothetical protein QRX50_36335 [Amycolatopsis sp. 2-15]
MTILIYEGSLRLEPGHEGWVRLYPINFRELGGDASFKKYDVITVDATPARQDSRRESWRPRMQTMRKEGSLAGWERRRPWLDPMVGRITMCRLHRGASMDTPSLALVRPSRIKALQVKPHPGWSPAQQGKIDAYVRQCTLFGNEDRTPLQAPRFSATFHYECEEPGCRGHRQGFIDWEFVAFTLLRLGSKRDREAQAFLEKQFFVQPCTPENDVAFYVGNVAAHPRTFSVLGLYYPPRKPSRRR